MYRIYIYKSKMQTQKKVSVALTFSLDVNNLVVAGNIL